MQIKSRDVGFAYVCSLLRERFPNSEHDVPLFRGEKQEYARNKAAIGEAGPFPRGKRNIEIMKIFSFKRYYRFNEYIKSTCKLDKSLNQRVLDWLKFMKIVLLTDTQMRF